MPSIPNYSIPTTRVGIEHDPSRGGDLQALRGRNRRAILTALLENDSATLTQLQQRTALSRPTVQEVLDQLAAAELINEKPTRSSTSRGGRPGKSYELAIEHIGLIGAITLGLRRVDVVLADARGTVLAHHAQAIKEERSAIDTAAATLEDMLRVPQLPSRELRALTIGVLGIVAPSGEIAPHPARPELTREAAFTPIIALAPRAAIRFENDANLATVGDYASLGADAPADMLGLHVDIAIGAGMIIRGSLHSGANGAAGEMGFASALGWGRSHEDLLRASDEAGMTPAELFRAAGEGTPHAVAIVAHFARAVAPGVVALTLAVNPQVISISGDICAAKEAFRTVIESEVAAVAPYPPIIRLSTLSEDSVMVGGLALSKGWLWSGLQDSVTAAGPNLEQSC